MAGTKDHLCLWKQILRGGECRSVAGWRIKHLLRPLWLQRWQRDSAEQRVRKQQTEKRESCDHRDGGRGSEGTKGSEHQESGWTWRDYWPCPEVLRWSACWSVYFYLQRVPATSVVPTSFKKSIIIPVPKNNKPSCLNDYRPVALTSIVMKVFERLVKSHISSSIHVTLDPLQFAYRSNRSTDDAISHILHSSLTHIDSSNGNYARLLFIDYSSAFNTIVPIKLTNKLSDLGLNTTLCDWIQDFLTGRPQVVKLGQYTSNSITLNVGAPQGCVLSPLLYSLYTHDCASSHSSTSIINLLMILWFWASFSNNDETAYLDEVERLTSWCQDNCLSLNVSKNKELIVDFWKKRLLPYTPLMISGTPVERVSSFMYLGVNISEDLTWTTHIQTQVRKARQRLYHLRQLRKFRVSPSILKTFYAGTIESVLTQCISVWYGNSSSQDCKALQRVVRLAEHISGSALPSLQDIYIKRCRSRAVKITKDSNHPGNCLFTPLPSGKRFRSLMAKTERLRRSFFPQAIRLLNSNWTELSLLTSWWLHLLITHNQ